MIVTAFEEGRREEEQKQVDDNESEGKLTGLEDDPSQVDQKEESHPKPPVALRFGEEIQPMYKNYFVQYEKFFRILITFHFQ